jgi:mono/diheme cytochrome c family protein
MNLPSMKNSFFSFRSFVLTFIVATLLLVVSCKKDEADVPISDPGPSSPAGTSSIQSSNQRDGDPAAGYDYLVNGDYIRSGIPYQLFLNLFGEDPSNELGRTGDQAVLDHEYNAADANNGVRIVGPNCLQCHAQHINGELVVGLGNSVGDFTTSNAGSGATLTTGIQFFYGAGSPEDEASQAFIRAVEATGDEIVCEVRGVNPADKLAAVLASHRDPNDLTWFDEPQLGLPTEVIPTDVPPWWHMSKKNAMFYNAAGTHDFARFMMSSNLLTVENSEEAAEVDSHFNDVLAFIQSIEPPVYPESIDAVLADEGKTIFETKCQGCHGSYGSEESYPNLLVDLETIGTDPLLIESNFAYPAFVDWWNESWFAQGEFAGILSPSLGYVAPPLDGIWATAPYLHNGSVPTLEDLLNSTQRPTYWKRTYDTDDVDYEKVGWNYTEEAGGSTTIYDTTLPGYSNSGHTFGDLLSNTQRSALIEYLKTL